MTETSEARLRTLLERSLEGPEEAEAALREAGPLAARLQERLESHRRLGDLGRELGAPLRAPAPAPSSIGRFKLQARIGEGGLSHVWRAFDPVLKREVALKVLSDARLDARATTWILNEARALARIRHEGVLQVLEIGEPPAEPFIAAELLPGPTLRAVIDELARRRDPGAPPPPTDERLRAAADRFTNLEARVECLALVAEALAHCHARDVLHRDVKPTNVMLDEDLRPRLIDFGLAHDALADEDSKLDLTAQLVGTAAYLAPEQVDGQRTGADHRSDQFSLGSLGYEWLALVHPFERDTRSGTLDAISRCHPAPLRRIAPPCSAALSAVIHGALEREPAQRYPDLAEFAADLRRVLRHEPPQRSAPSAVQLLRLWLRRNRRAALVAGATTALGALAVLGLVALDTARDRAQLLEQLGAVADEELEDAQPFLERGLDLVALAPQAAFLDARVLSGAFGRVVPVLEQRRAAWSRRLGSVFEAALHEEATSPVQFQAFRQLFQLDARVWPDPEANAEFRNRGRVLLPPGISPAAVALYQIGPLSNGSPLFAYLPTPYTPSLAPGHYRAHLVDPVSGSLRAEQEFFLDEGFPPARILELRPPREELFAATVGFEARDYVRNFGSLHVPAFRLLDHLVTIAEFQRFQAETGYEPRQPGNLEEPLSVDSEAPAWVSLDSAIAFCTWAGGRLPTLPEVSKAQEECLIPSWVVPGLWGEYLSEPMLGFPTTLSSLIDYGAAAGPEVGQVRTIPGREVPPSSQDKWSGEMRVGFRVAYSADAADAYRTVAR